MARHSFFLRLFLGNLAIVVLVLAVVAAVSYYYLSAEHLRSTYGHQDLLARLAQQYLEHVWPQPDAEVDRICKAFFGDAEGSAPPAAQRDALHPRFTVIAEDGRVLGDNLGDPARMANHKTADRPEVLAALHGRDGSNVRRSETLAADFRYVAMPIRHQGRVAGAVRIATPVSAVVAGGAFIRNAVIGAAILALLTFLLIGLLLNWAWYAPLRQIAEAARQMASGDLASRARMAGAEELRELAAALNAMRDSLAGQIRTITAQRENLREIVANLREGVIAMDGAGRVVLMNRAATDLLAADEGDLAGRPLDAVVRLAAIVDAYNRAAPARPVLKDIDVDIKNRRCHLEVLALRLVPAREGLGGLVVVRDVTDLVRTAAMKAEFVANASHELRTPLATLRAAVDALGAADQGDPEGRGKILAMLDRHVRRLEDLTADLLSLHMVESGKPELTVESVALGSIEAWARAHFAEAAAGKGVALEFAVPRPADAVMTDRALVVMILQNLIDNAIKFTAGGGRVACSMDRREGQACFRVSDTGIGIRREDQAHVFERFFQADAARSGDRPARGTGLGLAIVKHACDRLGAKVSLESELGKGTAVTVLVPDRGL
jgi:two-component system phosphate regulon sensor histidine kinase PhoR